MLDWDSVFAFFGFGILVSAIIRQWLEKNAAEAIECKGELTHDDFAGPEQHDGLSTASVTNSTEHIRKSKVK